MADDAQVHKAVALLASYRRRDGSSDNETRRAALREIIMSLNFTDRQFVRELVLANRGDMLLKLPIDLILNIMDFIQNPVDILNCRRVSRAWNSLWTNPRVMRTLMTSHFPGSLSELEKSTTQPLNEADAYRRICRRVARRQQGHHDSVVVGRWKFPIDPIFTLDSTTPDVDLAVDSVTVEVEPGQAMYHGGLLVWKNAYYIVVDNLHTLKRKIVNLPASLKLTNPNPTLEALSDELVVATSGRTLIVCNHLTLKVETLALPSKAMSIAVGADTVGVVTETYSMFVYRFGGPLNELPIPVAIAPLLAPPSTTNSRTKRLNLVKMILDPVMIKQQVLYVVIVERQKNMGSGKTTIVHYKDLVFQRMWERKCWSTPGETSSFRCIPVDTNGMYCLAIDWNRSAGDGCHRCGGGHMDMSTVEAREMLFDARKREFHDMHYHLPFDGLYDIAISDMSARYKTWCGRMLVEIDYEPEMLEHDNCPEGRDTHATYLLASVPACNITADSQPYYRIGEPLKFDDDKLSRHSLLCCWDPAPDSELEFVLERWKDFFSQCMAMDDNFIVSYGHMGFGVWRFEDNDQCPTMAPSSTVENEELRLVHGAGRHNLDEFDDEDNWEDEGDFVDEDSFHGDDDDDMDTDTDDYILPGHDDDDIFNLIMGHQLVMGMD